MATEEARRREDYINKVEARNKELEQSVRILQRRIVMLEEGKENIHSEGGSTNNCQDKTKHILEELHSKVSNYIVRKIDKQFQKGQSRAPIYWYT